MKAHHKTLSYFMITLLILTLLPLSALALSLQNHDKVDLEDANTFYRQQDDTFLAEGSGDEYYGYCVDGHDFVAIKQSTWSLIWINPDIADTVDTGELWNKILAWASGNSAGTTLKDTFSDSEYTVYKDDGTIYATYYVSNIGGSNYLLAPSGEISHFYYGDIDSDPPPSNPPPSNPPPSNPPPSNPPPSNPPPSNPPSSNPQSDRYSITIYYVDENGEQISDTYKTRANEGTSYDVSEYDAIAIDGYAYDFTDGDDLSGQLHTDVVITVHYTTEETIDEGAVPGAEEPGVIDGGDDQEVDIEEGDVPGAGESGISVADPSGNLPQTGTAALPVNPRFTLGAIALLLSMSAAGLTLFVRSRKEET